MKSAGAVPRNEKKKKFYFNQIKVQPSMKLYSYAGRSSDGLDSVHGCYILTSPFTISDKAAFPIF